MQIHIGRNNQQLGTFSTEQVLSGLASGQFLPTDIAWHEGLGDWEPLSSLAVLAAAPPSPVVPPAPAAAPPRAFELPRIERPETPPSRIKGLLLRAVVIVVLFLIAIPTAGFVQDKWLQSRSSANARTIVTACKQYAAQHNGSYPPDLATLIKEKIITDEKTLHCPMLRDDTQTGYEYYAAGVKQTDPPDKVIVISKASGRSGARVVGYNDGSVKVTVVPELPQAR
jgi:type II secretory pathway pseudopilin PulG